MAVTTMCSWDSHHSWLVLGLSSSYLQCHLIPLSCRVFSGTFQIYPQPQPKLKPPTSCINLKNFYSISRNCTFRHGGHHRRTCFGRRLRPSSTRVSSGFNKSMRQTMLIVAGVQSGDGVLFREWSQTWCVGDGKARFFLIYCHFWAFILCAGSWERMLFDVR